MKRRTFARGLFFALSSIPTIGFCESELQKWQRAQQMINENIQFQAQMYEKMIEAGQQAIEQAFEEAKMWAQVNPILPTNFIEWMAQFSRYNTYLFDNYKEIDPIWSPDLTAKFYQDYFNGTVIYYPNWIEQVLRIYESYAVSYLSDAVYATLCPKSEWLKLEKVQKPVLDWNSNNDLFEMWKYQKDAKKLLTKEFVAKDYFPNSPKFSTVCTLPLVARGGEHLAIKAYIEYRDNLLRDPMAQVKGIKPLPYYDWTNQDPKSPYIVWAMNDSRMERFNAERQKLGKQVLEETRDAIIRYATFKDDKLILPKKLLDHVNS